VEVWQDNQTASQASVYQTGQLNEGYIDQSFGEGNSATLSQNGRANASWSDQFETNQSVTSISQTGNNNLHFTYQTGDNHSLTITTQGNGNKIPPATGRAKNPVGSSAPTSAPRSARWAIRTASTSTRRTPASSPS
jgi:hypothetical protein